jgi:hypothetical protein
VFERDLVAVTERVGDEWGRDFEDEFADRSVARREEVDSEVAEAVHDGIRVEVLAGAGARKEP